MNQSKKLSDVWLKSAVLGCLWASSEIVLGSFLHNLKIPFRGDILTAIGIILLVSAGHKWKERGLFWRSGLICALMKSVSPSAIILAPMIAIFIEALLMETAIRIFRRNISAYLIGGVLAMSWTFTHKLINYVVLYGYNIVELYTMVARFVQQQSGIQFHNIWTPVMVLWAFYVLCGITATVAGIIIGRRTISRPVKMQGITTEKAASLQSNIPAEGFRYSMIGLTAIFAGLISVLTLMNFCSWPWWTAGSFVFLIPLFVRYKKAIRPLQKPGFWIVFTIITFMASLLFAKLQNNPDGLTRGLMMGLQMNLRAAVMIISFSAISMELSNPCIGRFFSGTFFRQLPPALEVAFETLPFVIASLPNGKNILKNPTAIIYQLISQADFWLDRMILRMKKKADIIIITGLKGAGKSKFLEEWLTLFKENHISVGGILSPAVYENNLKTGYDIVNVRNYERTILSRTTGTDDMIRVGPYFFRHEGISLGKAALSIEQNEASQVVIIDEIGPWEMDNQGWAENINQLIKTYDIPMIWVVRESLTDQVTEKWFLDQPLIISASENQPGHVFSLALQKLAISKTI